MYPVIFLLSSDAAPHVEIRTALTPYPGDLGDITTGFFDTHNVFDYGKALVYADWNVNTGSGGDIVKNHRNVNIFRNGTVVGNKAVRC